ncbi:MFS transporter [Kineococcus sp. GCM10028916]|uniref:MFS transporter n=1 Tax=Kineococcus sp. GCM10028916 TaxID=3273394 RepID=UPI00363A3F2C
MSTAAHPGPKTPNPWRVGVVAGMASYIDSAALVSTGIALVIYQPSTGITGDQLGLMSGVLTLCVAVGALVGGRLGDRLGRRRVFLTTMSLIVAGSALTTFGSTFSVLLAGIVLIGLGVGADLPVSLATIAEAAADTNRGKLIVLSNTLWLVGIIVAIGLASTIGAWGRPGGQLMFAHVGVVALVVLLARLSIPESRAWVEARRQEQAGGIGTSPDRARVRDLFRGRYGVPMVALVLFYGLTNLGANTTGQFNTFIATTYAGADVATFNRWALISLVASLVIGLGYMRFVDTHRRFTFFAAGAVVVAASYFLLAFAGFTLTTMVVALFMASLGNSVAFEGMMKIWTQESFPTTLRSTAQGTIVAIARVSAALLAAITPALLRSDLHGTFIALGVLAAIGFVVGGVTFRRPRSNEFDVTSGGESLETAARAGEPVDRTVGHRGVGQP